ncbi:MAG: asparagine synthase C-terminal domain-containing protein [Rubrivivax sp.]
MFRYIALAWDDAAAQQAATAARLAQRLGANWQPALLRPGLQVHVTATRPGINSAYPLHAAQGIVVGKLFRRHDLAQPATNDLRLCEADSSRVMQSGGQALVQDFWGRYVAIIPTAGGGARILRDPSGALPCFLLRNHGVWIVFSWLEDVIRELGVQPPGVNWDGVAACLLYGEPGGRETVLEGVAQVVPGEIVQLGAQPVTGELLWNAAALAQTPAADAPDTAARALRETVQACARSWASCYDRILFRLSGGVDSSILLSCLTRTRTSSDVLCLNYHSPGADSDERHYARLAAARAERAIVEHERSPDFRLETLLTSARTPTPGNYVGRMSARVDADWAARHGSQAMFTGAGGDQLFYEFDQWWPAADYLRSRGPDFGFPAAALDAARLGRVSVWKTIALALTERVRPSTPWDEAPPPLLGPVPIERRRPLRRFVHPALAQAGGVPIGKLNQIRALLHPAPYYDPLEGEAAPELVNPLLSQPLLECCLRLPTWVLTRGGSGRALARQAFADELPPEIARRRSKGGMEEHTRAVLLRNIDFARALLLDGELVRRGLLDRARVEEALSGRPTPLVSHVSQLHVYIGIEAWLNRWSPTSRSGAGER